MKAINGIGRYGTEACTVLAASEDPSKFSPVFTLTDFIGSVYRSANRRSGRLGFSVLTEDDVLFYLGKDKNTIIFNRNGLTCIRVYVAEGREYGDNNN